MDTIIIGAGAAGIAAGRRLAAKGLRFTILEAGQRLGGRAHTDASLFGIPVDFGAQRLRSGDRNPLVGLGRDAGFDLYATPEDERLYIGGREASVTESDVFAEMRQTGLDAIRAAALENRDSDCRTALKKLGGWRPTLEFLLGAYRHGRDCEALSVFDVARAAGGPELFCRQGLGALIARLGEDLPVRLGTPATSVDWSGPRVRVETAAGALEADSLIITVSTGVLADAGIRFNPGLPETHVKAFDSLKVGAFNHIVLDIPGNPFEWRNDDVIHARREDNETFSLVANVGGSSVTLASVAGSYAEKLEREGPRAAIEAATEFLIDLVGGRARRAIVRSYATQWGRDPAFRGAISAASPGAADARRALAEPVGGRILFAGEATHDTLGGTVGGAWIEGDRAALRIAERSLVPG